MASNGWKDRPVAVTGATGFIGGRLAGRLLDEGAEVRAAGRHLERAEHLAARGATLVGFDLLDPDSFDPVVEGCEVLFHLAAWLGGDERNAHAINVDATRDLITAAARAGVRRVVLVSTIAVYGVPDSEVVTEQAPLALDQRDTYGRTKALGEVAARRVAADRGVELVIVRPGMVYGPGSRGWTVGMLKLVKGGTPVIVGDGDGLAFPIYVDNLVDALLEAGRVPEAAGVAVHVVDASVTWRRWFGYFGAMCDREPRSMPVFLARLIGLAGTYLPLSLPLDRDRVALVTSRFRFDTTLAEELLGWSPRIDLDEGMRRSEEWLREQGRL